MIRAVVPLVLLVCLLPALAVPVPEVQHFSPASAVAPALADVLSLPSTGRPFVRYLSAYNEDEKDLATADTLASYAVNSLSFGHAKAPVLVEGTGGRLWRVVLSDYDISPKAWDSLGRKGSGRAPFPDPYFHLTDDVEEVEYGWAYYGEWQDSYGARVSRATAQSNGSAYRWVRQDRKWEKISAHKVRKTLQAPWLPEDDLVRLIAETDSYFPILRLDWFLYYSLLEPRYHELLNLPETEAELDKLLDVDEAVADRLGSLVRGAVLESEVAPNNRAAERTPTRAQHGKAYRWRSIDFNASIEADDILADVLNGGQAHEIIFSLPRNGLQGYYLSDGQGKRLDRAGSDFANDRRNPFRWVEVEIRNCFCCHAQGIIPIRDSVREDASGPLALAIARKGTRSRRARQIADRYFGADLEVIVKDDQSHFAGAVLAATRTPAHPQGMAAAAAALALQKALLRYERSRTLDDLASETGYPRQVILGVLERAKGTGLDQSASRLAKVGAKSRYDQFEAKGFGQLMRLLKKVPIQPPPPPAKGG